MIVHLPDPFAARVATAEFGPEAATVTFALRDAAHRDAVIALIEKALHGGYAVEVRLLHYSGCPDMVEQAKARKAREARKDRKRTAQKGLMI